MMALINMYEVQLLMPHFASMNEPKEFDVIGQKLMKGIVEEVFQIIGLDVW